MNSNEAKTLLLGLFEAYNHEEWDILFSKYLTENCVFLTGNGSIKGKDEIVKSWEEGVIQVRKEILLEPTNILVGSNQIAAEVPLKVIFKTDSIFGGIEFKKDQEIYAKCGDFYRLENNKNMLNYCISPYSLGISDLGK